MAFPFFSMPFPPLPCATRWLKFLVPLKMA